MHVCTYVFMNLCFIHVWHMHARMYTYRSNFKMGTVGYIKATAVHKRGICTFKHMRRFAFKNLTIKTIIFLSVPPHFLQVAYI